MGQAAAAKAEIKRRSDEAARVEQEKKESTVKGQTEKVKTAIQQHMADNADEMVDLVDAFLKLTPEQQAHAGEMHQLGCSGDDLNLTMEDCWKISEEPELEANVVRDLVATIITNLVDLFGAVLFWRWVPAKLYVRTAAEAAAKVVGFKAEKGARLNLDGTGQY